MSNPNINSFSITTIQGTLDLKANNNVLVAQIDPNYGGADVVPGQALIIVDRSGGVPLVTPATVNTDDVFAFANYNQKNATFKAGLPLEVSAWQDNVMYMTAAAAFNSGTKLMIQVSDNTVLTATSGKTIIGRALDKASAVGDIVRVVIQLPGLTA